MPLQQRYYLGIRSTPFRRRGNANLQTPAKRFNTGLARVRAGAHFNNHQHTEKNGGKRIFKALAHRNN